MKPHSIYLNPYTEKALKESNLLKLYSLSSLIEYTLLKQIPEVLKEKEIYGVEINKYLEMAKNKRKRQFIIMERKEKMSRAYFFKRFLYRMRQLIEQNIVKCDIVDILDSFLIESKTYLENEKVTNIITLYIEHIRKSKNLEEIKSYIDIKVSEFSDSIAKLKEVEITK